MKKTALLLLFCVQQALAMDPAAADEHVWPCVAIKTYDGTVQLQAAAAKALDSVYLARFVFAAHEPGAKPSVDLTVYHVEAESIDLVGRLACAQADARAALLADVPLERVEQALAVLDLFGCRALYDDIACILVRRLFVAAPDAGRCARQACARLVDRSDAVCQLVTTLLHERSRIVPAVVLPDENCCVPDLSRDGKRIVFFNNGQLTIKDVGTGADVLADATCRTEINESSTAYFCDGDRRVLVCLPHTVALFDVTTGCSIKHIEVENALVTLNAQKSAFAVLWAGGVALHCAHNGRRMSGFDCRHSVDQSNLGTWSADGSSWTYVPDPVTPKDERVHGQPIVLGDNFAQQVHCLADAGAALSADGKCAAYTQLAPLGEVADARYPGVCVFEVKKRKAQFFPRLVCPVLTPDGRTLIALSLNGAGVPTNVCLISLTGDAPARTIDGCADTCAWRRWLTDDGKRLILLSIGHYDQNMLQIIDMGTGERVGPTIACRWAEVCPANGRVAVMIDADDGAFCTRARELGSHIIAARGPVEGVRLKILDAYTGRMIGPVHRLCLCPPPLPVFSPSGTLLAFQAANPDRCLLFDARVGAYLGKVAGGRIGAQPPVGSMRPQLYDDAVVAGVPDDQKLAPRVFHVSGMTVSGSDSVAQLMDAVHDWHIASGAAQKRSELA